MKKYFIFVLLLLFSLPAIMPLFHKGFFVTDDGDWMIIRFSAFYFALRDGQFPVRFLHMLNAGYGYPVPTFLYPGFLYLGIPIQLITKNFVLTIKCISAISFLSSIFFTYFWLNRIFKKTASLIGALISLYLPYHLFDLYTRGSIGEVLALTWIPFILWMIEKENIFLISIGITLLIISHNTLAVLFLPLIVIYMVIKAKENKALIMKYVLSLITGIGTSVFFIIPALWELSNTRFSQVKISNPFSYFVDIRTIGAVSFFIIGLAIITFFYNRNKINSNKSLLLYFFALAILSIFLSTQLSESIWKSINTSWIQFPFRMLSILIIAVPFLTAFILDQAKGILKLSLLTILIVVIVVISAFPFAIPKQFIEKGNEYYFTNSATTTVQNEYMPIWVKQISIQKPEKKVEIIHGSGTIGNVDFNNKHITFNPGLSENSLVQVNTIYWPGWSVFIDNKKTQVSYNNPKGVMQVSVPRGKHTVSIIFGETPMRTIMDIISIISFFSLILISINLPKQFLKS